MTDITLPLKFKYFTLSVGLSEKYRTDDVQHKTYLVTNNDTEVIEMAIPCLEDAYKAAITLDRGREMMEAFHVKNNEGWKHLHGADIALDQEDDLPGESRPNGSKLN